MLEKIKQFLHELRKENIDEVVEIEKPVVIAIHGYGRRRKHELDNLKLWGEKDGFEVVQFDLFDIDDENDCDYMQWISRAKEVVDDYTKQGRTINLVGFSMGGVIASYLAATCDIHRLVLIAPAFSYLNVENITNAITKSAVSLWGKDKKEKKLKELPKTFFNAFSEIVKLLRKYIGCVNCPVLMLHGDEDEVIPLRSSLQAFEKIPHERKRLIILHKGHHRLLMDTAVNWEVYQNIRLFLDEVILCDQEIEQSVDILDIWQAELEAQHHEIKEMASGDEVDTDEL